MAAAESYLAKLGASLSRGMAAQPLGVRVLVIQW